MSADVVLDAIKANLVAAGVPGVVTGPGFAVKASTEPSLRQWDVVPTCFICPWKRHEIKRMSPCNRVYKQEYAIIYATNNQLNTNFPDSPYKLKQYIISVFMNRHTVFTGLNQVFDCKVSDRDDFDRSLLPQGYTYSCMNIVVDITTL